MGIYSFRGHIGILFDSSLLKTRKSRPFGVSDLKNSLGQGRLRGIKEFQGFGSRVQAFKDPKPLTLNPKPP